MTSASNVIDAFREHCCVRVPLNARPDHEHSTMNGMYPPKAISNQMTPEMAFECQDLPKRHLMNISVVIMTLDLTFKKSENKNYSGWRDKTCRKHKGNIDCHIRQRVVHWASALEANSVSCIKTQIAAHQHGLETW